jgi:hypothetical protein
MIDMSFSLRSRSSAKIFYGVGWVLPAPSHAVFSAIKLPSGETLMLLDKRIHLAALNSAAQGYSNLLRKSISGLPHE